MKLQKIFIASFLCIGIGGVHAKNETLDMQGPSVQDVRIESAEKIRGIVNSAHTKKANGGYYLARKTLLECKAIREDIESWSENARSAKKAAPSEVQLRVIDQLRERCNLISDTELNDENIEYLGRMAVEQNDPLSTSLADKAVSAKGKSQSRPSVLIDEISQRHFMERDPSSGVLSYLVDGKYYPVNHSPDLGLAVYLVPCKLGKRCDSNELEIAFRCASSGECTNGRYDVVKRTLQSTGKLDQYEEIDRFATIMAKTAARDFHLIKSEQ